MDYAEKRKNENRVRPLVILWKHLSMWWGIYATIFVFALVIGIVIRVSTENDHLYDTQPQYSDNANDLVAVCIKQTYAGYVIDCLYGKGFTLMYDGQPVERIDAASE